MNGNNDPVMVVVSGDALTAGEVRQAIARPIELVHADDMDWARRYLDTHGKAVDVLLCDREYGAEEYASLFKSVESHYPHVQCAVACLDFDIDKVLATKNMVTSMSVFRLPWNPLEVEQLFGSLVERAARARRRDRVLWTSLVDRFRRTRDNRVSLCLQAFAHHEHGPIGVKLLPYFTAARQVQEVETMADLETFDSLFHVAKEARRMVEITAHVKKWWEHFEHAVEPAHLPEIFDVEGESVRIKDAALQMQPVNGPCYQVPEFEACGLLAWLLFQPKKVTIRQCTSWVVEAVSSHEHEEAMDGFAGVFTQAQ